MWKFFIPAASLPLLWSLFTFPTQAQSITAAPDGTGTIIAIDGNTYVIQGGTQAGANLFHSFQDFGLSSREIAHFLSNPDITTIFGRVMGGHPSIIDGLLQASPSLYLMNPAGIVFGASASLNIGGDFTATTADRIGFSDGWFNATGTNAYATLTGTPNQFAFLSEQPGAILNFGNLNSNGDLSLIGGTVLNQGSLTTAATLTVAAVPGTQLVNLAQDGMLLSLDLPQDSVAAGITPTDLPTLLTGSATTTGHLPQPGDVAIAGTTQGQQVDLYAAGKVTPTDPRLVQGDTTVVRFPGADGTITLNIIDAHADNAQDLLFGGAAGAIATLIQDSENGIEAISETLARIDQPLDGMSITAEGNVGSFWLGNTWITHENIQNYQAQLAAWSSSFTDSADLLLYSCFTALGATGEALMVSLANSTGLDVAASTNVTGSANHGGDWVLERSTGSIETQNPFTDETLANWDGALAVLTVNSALDNTTNDGSVTLREAIIAANDGGAADATEGTQIGVNGAADEIRFHGVTNIALTLGELTIAEDLTITGGNTRVTIAGNNTNFRIFNVTGGVATTFDNLTITGGKVNGNGGGINSNLAGVVVTVTNSTISGNSANAQGGGIFSRGALTLTNSTVSGNLSNNQGGGMTSYKAITLTNSTVSDNSARTSGGGMLSFDAVTLTNSTVSGNSTNLAGGGIASNTVVTLTNSTVSGNSANGNSGGIFGGGAVMVTNSTVSGNSAGGFGGGIRALGAGLTATNATIAFNSAAGDGGGIFAGNLSSLDNTIVANNSTSGTGPDLFGDFTVNSSLILDSSGATIAGSNNILGQDPLLAPLANNGGPTQTHALQAGSPAIDGGNNALATTTTDQRGEVRIFNGTVDIGAYEFILVESPAVTVSNTVNIATADFETPIERLTAACPTIPEVELEVFPAPEVEREPDDPVIGRDERCLLVEQ